MYEQRHEITYKGGMSIWEGPIADLMLVQFLEKLKNNVRPLHASYCRSFCGGSSMIGNKLVELFREP